MHRGVLLFAALATTATTAGWTRAASAETAATAVSLPSREDGERACEGGDGAACNRVGFDYEHGLGVPQNKTKAAQLYQRACEAGYALGCDTLAQMYDKGEGVPRDKDKAVQLFEKACRVGRGSRCFRTRGTLLRFGFGVPRHWLANVPEGMRTVAQYGAGTGTAHLPSSTGGGNAHLGLGIGYRLGRRADLALDGEWEESYFTGRSTWSEVSFQGADDYVGYRYHGFRLTPLAYLYPGIDLAGGMIEVCLIGGAAVNLNTKLFSGQDAWNSFHPVFATRAPSLAVLGAGLMLARSMGIEVQVRRSLGGAPSQTELLFAFRASVGAMTFK